MKPREYIRLMALVKRLKRESNKYDKRASRAYKKTTVKNAQYTDSAWDAAWFNDGLAHGLHCASADLAELLRILK